MFFEGVEKRLEIQVKPEINLRQQPTGFWQSLVQSCNARILSVISNHHQDAYVLSESSLFVSKNTLIILTCGDCPLINAAQFFIGAFGAQSLAGLTYRRNREYRPEIQSSTFEQDVTVLRQHLDGKRFHLGKEQGDFFYAKPAYFTRYYQLQLHQMSGPGLQDLRNHPSPSHVKKQLKIMHQFSGFKLNDICFNPMGYSLNGINEGQYFTLHITPEQSVSYLSIEGNFPWISAKYIDYLRHYLKPKWLNIMTLDPSSDNFPLPVQETRKVQLEESSWVTLDRI